MWDLTEFKPAVAQLTESKNLSFIEWNPSGDSYVVVQNGGVNEATITVYDAGGKPSREIHVKARVNCLAFVTSNWLATGEESGAVRIYDVQNGEVVHTLTGHEKRIRGLAPFVRDPSPESSPESSPLPLLISASSDGTVQLWDLASPQSPVATYKHPACRITALCSFRPLRGHFEAAPRVKHAKPAVQQQPKAKENSKKKFKPKQGKPKETPKETPNQAPKKKAKPPVTFKGLPKQAAEVSSQPKSFKRPTKPDQPKQAAKPKKRRTEPST